MSPISAGCRLRESGSVRRTRSFTPNYFVLMFIIMIRDSSFILTWRGFGSVNESKLDMA